MKTSSASRDENSAQLIGLANTAIVIDTQPLVGLNIDHARLFKSIDTAWDPMSRSDDVAQRVLARRAGKRIQLVETADGTKVTSFADSLNATPQWGSVPRPSTRVAPTAGAAAALASSQAAETEAPLPTFHPLPSPLLSSLRTKLQQRISQRLHTITYDSAHEVAPLEGLDAQQHEVREFVQGVLDRGENHSMLLVGVSGTGKKTAVVSALKHARNSAIAASADAGSGRQPFNLVWLNGALIDDDTAALRAISRQLAVDLSSAEATVPVTAAKTANSRTNDRVRADPVIESKESATEEAVVDAKTAESPPRQATRVQFQLPESGQKRKRDSDNSDNKDYNDNYDLFATQPDVDGDGEGSDVDIFATQPADYAASDVDDEQEIAAADTQFSASPDSPAKRMRLDINDRTPEQADAGSGPGVEYEGLRGPVVAALKKAAGRQWEAIVDYAKEQIRLHGNSKGPLGAIIQQTVETWTKAFGGKAATHVVKRAKDKDAAEEDDDEDPAYSSESDDEGAAPTKVSLGHIDKNAHVNHLAFLSSALKDNKGANVPTFLIITDFDVFAHSTKQTLLYNLLDMTASKDAHIAIIGTSTRLDVVELLEKRLKSRFSHRLVLFPRPTFDTGLAILKQALSLPSDIEESNPEFASHWKKAVHGTLLHPRLGLINAWRRGLNTRALLSQMLRCVSRLTAEQQLPSSALLDAPDDIGAAGGRMDNGASMREKCIVDLSAIELSLLAVMAHIEQRHALDSTAESVKTAAAVEMSTHSATKGAEYNFRIVYHELHADLSDTNSTVIARSLQGGAGVDRSSTNLASFLPPADVALLAFERLLEMGLVRLHPQRLNTMAVSTEGIAGASSCGPDLLLWNPKSRVADRQQLPYACCKLLIDADSFLRIVGAECGKVPRRICLTTELAAWILQGGKKAPIY